MRLFGLRSKAMIEPTTQNILDLWEAKNDTLSIANLCGVHESRIYNVLARLSGETESYRFSRKDAYKAVERMKN